MSLDNHLQFYIGGDWVAPLAAGTMDVINPSTARAFACISIGSSADVDNVHMNYPEWDTGTPFGGFKQSGNGREYAEFGLDDFLEIKGVVGDGS